MKKEERKIFSSRDIHLAATLVTLRFDLIGVDYQIEGDNARPVGYFSFEDTPEIRQADQHYWRGQLSVEPRTFVTNWRGLKAQVNGTYKNPHTNFGPK